MVYSNDVIVTEEFLQYAVDARRNVILSAIAGLIRVIPIESLYKLFNVQTIDPNSEESERQLRDIDTPESTRKMLITLRDRRQQHITVSINIPS